MLPPVSHMNYVWVIRSSSHSVDAGNTDRLIYGSMPRHVVNQRWQPLTGNRYLSSVYMIATKFQRLPRHRTVFPVVYLCNYSMSTTNQCREWTVVQLAIRSTEFVYQMFKKLRFFISAQPDYVVRRKNVWVFYTAHIETERAVNYHRN